MSIQDISLTPGLLTTGNEEQQAKALYEKQENLDRDDFLVLFTTQLKNQNPWILLRMRHLSHSLRSSRAWSQ